jgi:hypothetical protein
MLTGCTAALPMAALAASLGLTVVPPGPVTDRIEIEARLSVRNPGPAERSGTVRFYWDAEKAENLIHEESVRLPAGATALVTAWAPTAGRVGRHVVLAQVEAEDGTVREKRWPITVAACETRALPALQAGWCDLAALVTGVGGPRNRDATEGDLRGKIDAMCALGMGLVILTYAEYGAAYYPSALPELSAQPLPFDAIETVLSQADRNGMHVIVGLGRGDDMNLLWDGLGDEARTAKGIAWSVRLADELWQRYGHHPSFYGWYPTHEASDLPRAAAYYDAVADHLHSLAPDKPVLIAPSGAPIVSPEVLRTSHVDIFAYQDCVGPGYKDYKYTLDPEVRLADLPVEYARFAEAHRGAGKHFWSDLEVWRANPETGYTPFHPAPIEQVARQIAIEAQYAEYLTGYEFLTMMETAESSLCLGGPDAVRLYEEYRDYVRGLPFDLDP